MRIANVSRTPAFSAFSQRATIVAIVPFASASYSASVKVRLGFAVRLKISFAKRSLMSVRYSGGTVAKTSASTSATCPFAALLTAALFAA